MKKGYFNYLTVIITLLGAMAATLSAVEINKANILFKLILPHKSGWAANPSECNLYSKEGFPASPFRTDDWAVINVK